MNLENKNSFLLNSALFFSTMGSTATTLGFITYILIPPTVLLIQGQLR